MDFSDNKLCGVTIKWSAPSQPKFTVQHQASKPFGSCFFSAQHEKCLKQRFQELFFWDGLEQFGISCALFWNRAVKAFLHCIGFLPTVLQQIGMHRKASGGADWLCFLADMSNLTFKQI